MQVEIPYQITDTLEDVETVPIQKPDLDRQLLLRDVAQVRPGTMPGEYDRYNMKRTVSLTANIAGEDLGRVARGPLYSSEPPTTLACPGEGRAIRSVGHASPSRVPR